MKFIKVIYILALLTHSINTEAQDFESYLNSIPELSIPRSFQEAQTIREWVEYDLPDIMKDHPQFVDYKALCKILIDEQYTILLIRRNYNDYDEFDELVSFDFDGSVIDRILVGYTADSEGAFFAISPEKKIRVAFHGTAEAYIKTYVYSAGNFVVDGETEYGYNIDDNMPEY